VPAEAASHAVDSTAQEQQHQQPGLPQKVAAANAVLPTTNGSLAAEDRSLAASENKLPLSPFASMEVQGQETHASDTVTSADSGLSALSLFPLVEQQSSQDGAGGQSEASAATQAEEAPCKGLFSDTMFSKPNLAPQSSDAQRSSQLFSASMFKKPDSLKQLGSVGSFKPLTKSTSSASMALLPGGPQLPGVYGYGIAEPYLMALECKLALKYATVTLNEDQNRRLYPGKSVSQVLAGAVEPPGAMMPLQGQLLHLAALEITGTAWWQKPLQVLHDLGLIYN
jgi:hypothetical protein